MSQTGDRWDEMNLNWSNRYLDLGQPIKKIHAPLGKPIKIQKQIDKSIIICKTIKTLTFFIQTNRYHAYKAICDVDTMHPFFKSLGFSKSSSNVIIIIFTGDSGFSNLSIILAPLSLSVMGKSKTFNHVVW